MKFKVKPNHYNNNNYKIIHLAEIFIQPYSGESLYLYYLSGFVISWPHFTEYIILLHILKDVKPISLATSLQVWRAFN